MKTLEKISKIIAALIPGTVQHLAKQKRTYGKELRKAGYSRSHAATIVWERFKNHGQETRHD